MKWINQDFQNAVGKEIPSYWLDKVYPEVPVKVYNAQPLLVWEKLIKDNLVVR